MIILTLIVFVFSGIIWASELIWLIRNTKNGKTPDSIVFYPFLLIMCFSLFMLVLLIGLK